jgi:ribosomal protein S18 acetylase RimI-like enzyme
MAGMTIRRAGLDDRDTVVQFAIALQAAEHEMHPSRRPGAALGPVAIEELYRRTGGDDGAILLAEQDGAAVGYIAFYVETLDGLELRDAARRSLYISDLGVVPAMRGKGIAGELLAEAERRCRALRLPRLSIGVLAENDAALAAYRRAGYVPYEFWLEKNIATGAVPPRRIDGLSLRALRPDDRHTMLGFLRQLADDEAGFHWAMRPGSEMTMAEVDRAIAEIAAEDGTIVIAELDGRPVGYAGVVCQDARDEFELKDEWRWRGLVTDIYVAPEGRRRGIAQALLGAAEAHVLSRGIGWLQICVSPDNGPANALYAKAGFRDYELVLEKRLG